MANPNLITNFDFETNTTGWQLASDFTRSSDDAQNGSFAIKQVSTSDFANFATENAGISVAANSDYTLTFWVKGTVNSGFPPNYQINTTNAFAGPIKSGQVTATGGSWEQKTIKFNTGSATKIWIRFFNNNGDVAYFYDNFSLTLDASVSLPTTPPAFLYRGISVSGLEFGSNIPGSESIDYFQGEEAVYEYLASKGFNVARLAFKWERLQPEINGALDSTYKGYIDNNLTWANTHGIKVILDCHNYARRRIVTTGGFTDNFASDTGNFSGNKTISGGVMAMNAYTRVTAGSFLNEAPLYCQAEMQVVNTDGQIWNAARMEVMYADANNHYFFTMNAQTDTIELFKKVGGAETSLGSAVIAGGINTGTFYTVRVDVENDEAGKIKVYFEGGLEITANVDAGLSAGAVGFYGSGVRMQVDDFVLDVNGDQVSGGGAEYKVGDGTLTTAHVADLWDKISEEYKNDDRVLAYDLMNEPYDMTVNMTPSNYKTTATATLMFQACVDAIRANSDTKACIVELDDFANLHRFTENLGSNPDPWITDPENNIIYSAHYYFDSDHSGTFTSGWYDNALKRMHDEVLPFMEWCKAKGVTGYVGEFGVPSDDDRWLAVVYQFLKYCDDYQLWTTAWAMGPQYSSITTLQPTSNYTVDRHWMSVLASFPGGAHSTYKEGYRAKFQSVDLMPLSKDSMRGFSDAYGGKTLAQISGWVQLCKQMNVTHVAISCPMDEWSDYPANQRSQMDSRGGVGYLTNWINAIHDAGLNVFYRGTFNEFEGIYDTQIKTYSLRDPGVSVADNANLAEDSWLKKTWLWLQDHATLFRDKDIFAPFPEPTSFQFSPTWQSGQTEGLWESNAILSQFYFDLALVCGAAFAEAGVRGVYLGMSSCTYTELNSGYVQNPFYQAANVVAVDHYNSNTANWGSELSSLISAKQTALSSTRTKLWVQEFGDIYNTNDTPEKATKVQEYLDEITAISDDVIGINYWAAPSALFRDNLFTLTDAGQNVKNYFANPNDPNEEQDPISGNPPGGDIVGRAGVVNRGKVQGRAAASTARNQATRS